MGELVIEAIQLQTLERPVPRGLELLAFDQSLLEIAELFQLAVDQPMHEQPGAGVEPLRIDLFGSFIGPGKDILNSSRVWSKEPSVGVSHGRA